MLIRSGNGENLRGSNSLIVHLSGSGKMLGGAELSLYELIEKEVSHNIDCLLIVPDEGSFAEKVRALGVSVKVIAYSPWVRHVEEKHAVLVLKTIIKFIRNLIAELRLFFLLKSIEPSVLHINTSAVCSGFFAAKKLGIPVVWHVRELADNKSGRIFYRPDKQRSIIASSDKVIAVSDTVAKTIEPYALPNRICTVYDSVPAPPDVDRVIFSGNCPVIAIIGSINPAKGQIDAVKALATIASEGLSFKVLIAGDYSDNQYKEELETLMVSEGIGDKFHYLGKVPEPYEVLLHSDICLNCSKSESFGRVTVEGLLAGCLTIGRDTSGTTELLSKGHGLLFNSPAELSQLLRWSFMNRAESRIIAKQGREYAWMNYSNPERSFKEIMEVLNSAAN